jgi:NTP pyrophosphatase (non-canonical NTP hydrolase)
MGMRDEAATVAALREVVGKFVSARDWHSYHDAKNLAMSIAIEAAELMEHFQWVRSEELGELLANEHRRDEIREELADVACYVLALANALEMDLSAAVEEKMRKNAEKYPVDRFRGRYFKPGE